MNGLMTRGLVTEPSAFPAKIPASLLIVVQNTLSAAWRKLLKDVETGEFSICAATEDEITERLHMILGELHAAGDGAVRGLSQFETSIREGNLRSFDGKHLDCQPDLTFRPLRGHIQTGNTVPAAIFVECKPIDSVHPVASTYCRAGLIRFVNGDYAWAVDRAMMMAYVRNVCTLPKGLSSCLENMRLAVEMNLQGRLETISPTANGDIVCQSKHDRSFCLSGGRKPVGLITVHHLWLHPVDACETTRCKGM
jgi:hypothetical protein